VHPELEYSVVDEDTCQKLVMASALSKQCGEGRTGEGGANLSRAAVDRQTATYRRLTSIIAVAAIRKGH